MMAFMTWSIVARDPATGAFGVAVATRFFAVGALCPHVASGVGALASQALMNPLYGARGLRLLADGVGAADVVRLLVAPDQGRDQRQVHVIDAAGGCSAHTGASCIDWCGHHLGDGFSVAGNMLAGPRVVADTAGAYVEHRERPFAERLIRALEAGEAAGGDKRGKQSAALRIHDTEDYPALDLRVDDHADPLAELKRLYGVAQQRFIPFSRCLPSSSRPAGVTDRAEIEAAIARWTAGLDKA